MSDEEFFGLPESLPPHRLRTELPTIVREMCPKALHIAVWLAIRWLLAGEKFRALDVREIAACAKINYKTVAKVIEDLISLKLIELVGYEDLPKNLTGAPHGKAIIRIPKWIEQENAHFTAAFLARSAPATADVVPDEQLELDLDEQAEDPSVPKTEQALFQKRNRPPVPKTEQGEGPSVPKTEQALFQKRNRPPVPKTEQGGTSLKLKEKNLKEGRNKIRRGTSYRTPEGELDLIAHPFEIWEQVNPNANSDDAAKLARLAADHDAPYRAYSGGYGMYWVGRAIQAANRALDLGKPITINYVRNILTSWRTRTTDDTSAYGSDAPNFQQKQQQRQRRAAQQAVAAQAPEPAHIPINLVDLWQRVLEQLLEVVERDQYDTWLKDAVLIDFDEATAHLAVDNIFAREKVQAQFAEQIATLLSAELGRVVTVEVHIDPTIQPGGPHAA